MPVAFDNFQINDHGRALTVENAFRFYGTWAGIHDFHFDRLYRLGDDSGWAVDSGLTASFNDNAVTLESDDSWRAMVQLDAPLPADHTIYVTTEGDDNYIGLVVGALDNENFYLVCNEGENTFKIYQYEAGTPTLKRSMYFPYNLTSGTFHCTFRPFATGNRDDDLWLSISLWRNDRQVLTYVEKIDEPLTGPYYFGLAAYSTNTRTFTNVYVPELCTYAEYGTLDPGEEAMGGLQRAIEGRYLRFFVRFDGSLRAFRPKTQASAITLTAPYIDRRGVKIDRRVLRSHVRIMGAYDWGEALDATMLESLEHRFVEITNPMLMSEADCIAEAERHLRRLESEATTREIPTVLLPLLEPEDRITDNDGEWVITEYSKQFQPGAIECSYFVRKYVEGV